MTVNYQMVNICQVAAQQGSYLADCFNKMEECKEHPEGPLHITQSGRHYFRPFRYLAFCLPSSPFIVVFYG
jgi:NADH:ubiquinone reductase (non-electrogenic)